MAHLRILPFELNYSTRGVLHARVVCLTRYNIADPCIGRVAIGRWIHSRVYVVIRGHRIGAANDRGDAATIVVRRVGVIVSVR